MGSPHPADTSRPNLASALATPLAHRRLALSQFLEQLRTTHAPLPRKLEPAAAAAAGAPRLPLLSAAAFRWMLNEDAWATDKLSEGIRAFGHDTDRVEAYLTSLPLWNA
jgi:transaldolase